ncbi:MAG: nucleotidyltransferase substrate binding protein [Lunatimonas sp.]|uniref:nucleotidyltransferase substrate binding protein n=1 Tax=Lunatimonas sp. TaxID=2060141 RepID=UPI00263AD87D|nr:nucleotidyltransferase substrate binding protein [Lunatimonas sp.]MCC5936399.1 nucleotidyltransferase substrate binding protein [Lunatimonas sp.]
MKQTKNPCAVYFERYQAALEELSELIDRAKTKGLLETQRQEIVRNFEVVHDLALETMHAYFKEQGRAPFSGSRDATVEAFNEDLIDDGQGWLDMIICRIKYNPLYPGDYLGSLSDSVVKNYIKLLENFERNFRAKTEK